MDHIETDLDGIWKLCKDININKSSCIEHLSSEILRFSEILRDAQFLDDIYKAMNENKILVATYLDAMMAFNTVDHTILLKKAEFYGIKGFKAMYIWNRHILNDNFRTKANSN